jgi:hypothetical protein
VGACLAACLAVCLASMVAACAPNPDVLSAGEGSVPREPSTLQPDLRRQHATYLRPGDCLLTLPADLIATLVSCELPHAAEYGSIYVLPEGPWPGREEAMRKALEWCGSRLRVRESRLDEIKPGALLPLEGEWPAKRTAYCLAVPIEGELVGRVLK